MSVQSDLVQVPEVMEDESGGEFFAAGHVEPALFLLGLLVSQAVNVGDQEAFDLLGGTRGPRGWRTGVHESAAKLLTEVKHVWFRYDRLPEDDEHMALCEPTDDGAEPFTWLSLG